MPRTRRDVDREDKVEEILALAERQLDEGGYVARAASRGWDDALRRLAKGRPRLFRYGTVADLRTIEEWIHHEDIRRANGDGPRASSSAVDAALWDAGQTILRFPEFLPGREGIEAVVPGHPPVRLRGEPRVRVEGAPGEILLYLAGRVAVAEVSVDGDAEAVAELQQNLRV